MVRRAWRGARGIGADSHEPGSLLAGLRGGSIERVPVSAVPVSTVLASAAPARAVLVSSVPVSAAVSGAMLGNDSSASSKLPSASRPCQTQVSRSAKCGAHGQSAASTLQDEEGAYAR